jgi:hypothetical protein
VPLFVAASSLTILQIFGHIPLGMREFNKHLIAIPTFKKPSVAGASAEGNILIKDDAWAYNILIHELSHALDSHALTHDLGEDHAFSSGHLWQKQYSQDERSISQYGATSWHEDLADSGVIAIYDLVVPGGIRQLQPNWAQVSEDDL